MKKARTTAISIFIVIFGGMASARGQEPWTLDKTLEVRGVASPVLSPDGLTVAYTVTKALVGPETSRNQTHIWLNAVDGSDSRQLTRGQESAFAPSWSPDGKWLAFLTAREKGRHNVWLIRPDGGEAIRLTDAPESIRDFRWSPDGSKIGYLMPDPLTESARKAKAAMEDARVVDTNFHFTRLYWIPVGTEPAAAAAPVQLTKENFDVLGFDWSPDGKRFVIWHAPTPRIFEWRNTDISTVDADGESLKPLVVNPGMDMAAVFSPDGKTIAFVSDRGDRCWARNWRICLVPEEGGPVRVLAQTFDGMPGEAINAGLVSWAEDGSGVFYAETKGTTVDLFFAPADGGSCEAVPTQKGMKSFFHLLGKRDLLAYVREDLSDPPEVYVQFLGGQPRRLTNVNAHLGNPAFSRAEVIRWPSFDKLTIEGILHYPLAYAQGRRYPLLVELHGGPTWGFLRTYSFQTQVLTAAGFAVLQVNPRGSAGYGKDFRFANLGDWGGKDVQDVLTGVDRLVEIGLADPARLGVFGWSYGGYLTGMTISTTRRFGAAVVGAGLTDLASQAGTTDITGFVPSFMGSEFWDPGDPWKGHSAIDHIREITTPTLILHGEDDARVPITQGYELYRALKRKGIEAEMVVYPRTGHSPDEPKFVRDVFKRYLDWFTAHLHPER